MEAPASSVFRGKRVSDEEEVNMMQRYKYGQYMVTSVNSKDIRDMLDRYGVCIVPGVLTREDCATMEADAWSWLEHVTQDLEVPWRLNDSATWSSFFDLLPLHSMLLQHWGIGHSQWCWNVRMHRGVQKVFESIWNTPVSEMLTSFDGASLHLPHETTKRGFYRGATWLHTDQSYTRPDHECIQSWVTARDVRVGDATLAFIPGSHLLHSRFAARFGVTDKADWFKLDSDQQKWYLDETGCGGVEFINCPRGSMVLWDSRLIHSGSEPLRTRPRPNARVIAYVCFMPRSVLGRVKSKRDKVLAKRIKAFEELRMTTHNPAKVKLFGKLPRLYGKAAPAIRGSPPPVLDNVGRRLVGY